MNLHVQRDSYKCHCTQKGLLSVSECYKEAHHDYSTHRKDFKSLVIKRELMHLSLSIRAFGAL